MFWGYKGQLDKTCLLLLFWRQSQLIVRLCDRYCAANVIVVLVTVLVYAVVFENI